MHLFFVLNFYINLSSNARYQAVSSSVAFMVDAANTKELTTAEQERQQLCATCRSPVRALSCSGLSLREHPLISTPQ